MKEPMMDNTPLFSILTDEQRAVIAEHMVEETRHAGEVLYLLGKPATTMYLIKSGWARLVTEEYVVLANLSQGSLLGDTDFLTGHLYSTSAEAASDMVLWSLSARDLAEITVKYPDIARRLKTGSGVSDDQRILRHLRKLSLLSGLSQEQVADVAQHLREEKFGAEQSIYRQGMPGDALYLIDTGQVEISVLRPGSRQRDVLGELGPGEFFGETVLLSDEPHESDVVAKTDVVAWALSRADFEALAMRYPSLVLNLSRVLSQRLRETTTRPMTTVRVREVRAAPRPARVAPAAKPRVEPQIRRSDMTGAMAALTRSADALNDWFGARSTGAKLRLVAVVLLLIWLLGVAAPSAIISLLSRSDSGTVSNNIAGARLNDQVLLVAMSAELQPTATYTPWPTETPVPTPTFTPSPTPTNTATPTPTFTPSPTPIPPTSTPIPPTRAPQPVVAQAEAVAAAPAPTVKYKLVEMRRMTPCENKGKHNVYIKVIDAAGNPVDGVTLVQSPANQVGNVLDKSVSGVKGPGLAEFVLWKQAEYAVYVTEDGTNPASTDVAQPVHSNFTDEATCADGEGGNTLFHNSFNLVFQVTS